MKLCKIKLCKTNFLTIYFTRIHRKLEIENKVIKNLVLSVGLIQAKGVFCVKNQPSKPGFGHSVLGVRPWREKMGLNALNSLSYLVYFPEISKRSAFVPMSYAQ